MLCIALVCIIVNTSPVMSQGEYYDYGLPYFETFLADEHGGGQQSWDIEIDKRGIVYVANTNGVLEYDGSQWNVIDINGSLHILSMDYNEESDRVYLGGTAEFGYFDANSSKETKFVSLLPLVESENQSFTGIRNCTSIGQYTFFVSDEKLFVFDGSSIRTYNSQSVVSGISETEGAPIFNASFVVDETLYILHSSLGVIEWTPEGFKVPTNADVLQQFTGIRFIQQHQDNKILFGTSEGKLYTLNKNFTQPQYLKTEAEEYLREHILYEGGVLLDGSIGLTTINGGFIIVNQQGKWVQLLNTKAGLPVNDISFFGQEKNGAIWLAMNIGVARIEWPPVISMIDDRVANFGDVLSLTRHNGRLYAGSYTGLYRQESSTIEALENSREQASSSFRKTGSITSEVWGLLPVKDKLAVASVSGLMLYDDVSEQEDLKLSAPSFGLAFSKQDSSLIHVVLEDGYGELIYNTASQTWQGEISPYKFEEYMPKMLSDNQNLWFITTGKSVFRKQLNAPEAADDEFNKYNESDGLPGGGQYGAALFNGKYVIGTKEGAYHFVEDKQQFEPYCAFDSVLGGPKDFYGYTEASDGFWLGYHNNTEGDRAMYVRQTKAGKYKPQFVPFNRITQSIADFFYEDPVNGNVTWIGAADGLLRFDKKLDAEKNYEAGTVLIRQIRTIENDSLLLSNISAQKEIVEFPVGRKQLRFLYALPGNDAQDKTKFRYFLEGFDEQWSPWTNLTQKDYTNIPHGDYTFYVEAQNVYGKRSGVTSFVFNVATPWYSSGIAWIFYILGFVFLLGFITREYGQYRARRQAYIDEVRAIERENVRKKLAADFHDEFGNRITRLGLFISRLQHGEPIKNIEVLNKMELNTNALYSETRDFIWQMDPGKDSLFNTFLWLKKFGEEFFEISQVEFEVRPIPGEIEDITIEMNPRSHILRIFKEAMNNTQKYSEASKCVLTVEQRNGTASITFVDNGKGMDLKSCITKGNGLSNMKERAEKAGGRLLIQSKEINGTEIKYEFSM
ncbi:MAG: triple tyrosine motif-containing protein [Balneolaceae bacterium]